ncbi:hypothetical protein EI168_09660 [Halomonas sp. FME1]|uniref:Uncharacterized protein n=1 Tax=Halomonas casei TaxID=2742613 RepID=A0ABR9F1Z9_9GAMM|nr:MULTISPECIES: hypothetical protein [Halomonas]MBE0400374.1 hypothetical protein [Halomonas casei]PCC20944.1 hypothetical protein CIK78_01995 [Halomonas sp. JB37]
MKRDYLKRIAELEQLQGSQPITAATYRDVYTNAGIDVPEPLPDEDPEEYINRLPGDAQLKLLAFYGVEL